MPSEIGNLLLKGIFLKPTLHWFPQTMTDSESDACKILYPWKRTLVAILRERIPSIQA
jgi:hypothetical protein